MSVDAGGRIRIALFTPGTEAERMRKAVAAGADICIFDLEDSVAPERLRAARDTVARTVIDVADRGRIWVRGASRFHSADEGGSRFVAPGSPRRDRATEGGRRRRDRQLSRRHRRRRRLSSAPRDRHRGKRPGVLNCPAIALARGLAGLALGRFDLAADLGIDPGDRTPALSAARALIVLASAAAGLVQPLESPWLKIADLEGLREAAEAGWREGLVALLIHPSHVQAVNQVFSPSADQLTWARNIVTSAADAAATGRGAYTQNGQMVDEAIVRRARAILRDAEAG